MNRSHHRHPAPRHVIHSLASVAFLLAVAQQPARAVDHTKGAGEPYQLLGKRLVFTTWDWVRIGQLDWQNAAGESVYAGKMKAGPFDAHFTAFDAPSGVRLVAEPAQRGGRFITRDRPWEQMGVSIKTILRDSGKYRAWGGCQDAQGKRFSCYFESTDGKQWEKPKLGLVEYAGSRENNLLPYDTGAVFIDPTAPPEQRYKTVKEGDADPARFAEYKKHRPWSVMATETDPGRVHAILAAVSPDGLNWTQLPEVISVEPSDTQIIAAYDAALKRYVMFTRSYMVNARAEGLPPPQARRHQFVQRRAIGRSEAQNFAEFPLSEVIIEPDNDMPPTDTYYTNAYTTIPGAPDFRLLFPAIYHQGNDTTSIEMFTSGDGKVWHRAPATPAAPAARAGSPLLGTAEFGQWDGGCVFASPNLVELADGTWALPYTGYAYPHKYPRGAWSYDVGLATWPKGRLMALAADGHGEFATVAFMAPGKKLRINAVTDRAGGVLVEAADLEGKPISGRSFADATAIIGDQYHAPVAWKGNDELGIKPGEPLMLRFRLDRAKIYGLDFE